MPGRGRKEPGMADTELKVFDYDKAEIGEELGSYEYILTQEMVDAFRSSVQDPGAPFPTLGVKHDATAFAMVYDDPIGTVNAGNEVEFFNPPKGSLEKRNLFIPFFFA
ncbi:MAG: hypothetical protein CMJ65_18555, partial [Planctomycetaceae bacterium]|nr:hypothetical protein [Planctomycetaceae bacterium]